MRARVPVAFAVAAVACAAAACSSRYTVVESPSPMRALDEPRGGVAVVCVHKRQVLPLGVVNAVFDNGRLVGALKKTGFFCYEAEPGDHVILTYAENFSNTRQHAFRITLVAGQRYVVRVEADDDSGCGLGTSGPFTFGDDDVVRRRWSLDGVVHARPVPATTEPPRCATRRSTGCDLDIDGVEDHFCCARDSWLGGADCMLVVTRPP